MFRALTIPSCTDKPVLILNPDMCAANVSATRAAKSKGSSLTSAQPSEILIEQDQRTSYIEPTRTYEVLNRQTAVGSQVSENIIPMRVFMFSISAQVSQENFQPETKSLSIEATPSLKTAITGIMFCLTVECITC